MNRFYLNQNSRKPGSSKISSIFFAFFISLSSCSVNKDSSSVFIPFSNSRESNWSNAFFSNLLYSSDLIFHLLTTSRLTPSSSSKASAALNLQISDKIAKHKANSPHSFFFLSFSIRFSNL